MREKAVAIEQELKDSHDNKRRDGEVKAVSSIKENPGYFYK